MSIIAVGTRSLPDALEQHIRLKLREGGAVFDTVKLNTKVPGLGPYHMDLGGAFTLTIYAGPMLSFEARPSVGRVVDEVA